MQTIQKLDNLIRRLTLYHRMKQETRANIHGKARVYKIYSWSYNATLVVIHTQFKYDWKCTIGERLLLLLWRTHVRKVKEEKICLQSNQLRILRLSKYVEIQCTWKVGSRIRTGRTREQWLTKYFTTPPRLHETGTNNEAFKSLTWVACIPSISKLMTYWFPNGKTRIRCSPTLLGIQITMD